MIKIGMMIGERYEILEKIGTGGMSDVYKAKCHKLNRYVAVKVLKQEFSENANFVSKFKIEAQAAAGLMHPNIVNVYDVGDENGIYYIVMELVEGITLKKYIEKKARLSYKEAVSIAIQVSMGIEAAHNNHIIHRDIKPQNIIISKDGKVKVTDFGIAKAATSNTITSNVMGSVHYTSPEQARGGYSDEKSDIYSLGITMFEMLTGRVPFNGETTVAIAIKHIQEEMPSPKEFVPEIPVAVESIVLKCCQKSSDRRYQNVSELIADLKQSLMNPDEDFVVTNDPDFEGSTRMVTEEEFDQIKRKSAYADDSAYDSMRLRSDTEALYENTDGEVEEEYDDYNPKMEKVTTLLAIGAGVVICIIVIVLAIKVFGGSGSKEDKESSSPIITSEEESTSSEAVEEKVNMPDVTGKTVEDARNALAELGLVTLVTYEESETIDVGTVMSTDIAAGTEIAVGSTVTLTASSGTSGVEVPDVTTLTEEEAASKLEALGFSVNKMQAYSDSVAEGVVALQTPSGGTKAPKGSIITLTVSLGAEDTKVMVPSLVGIAEDEAIVKLVEAGLTNYTIAQVYSSEYAEGIVTYQSYTSGSWIDPTTNVEIKVSKGAESYTYRCNLSITAPTSTEAPDYTSNTPVKLKLVTDDGETLLETTVTSFPTSANFKGISSSGGTLTMTYTVTTEGTTSTDADGNTVTVPGTSEEKSFTRRIEFTVE